MKRYFGTLTKSFLFWLLFFFITRSIFLIANYFLLADIAFKEIVAVYYYALSLDISATCYLLSIPLLLFSMQLFYNHRIISIAIRIITFIELLFASIIALAEAGIYSEWHCKLNYKALLYLRHPTEIFSTATTSFAAVALLSIVLLTVTFYLLYAKIVLRPEIISLRKSYFKSIVISLVMPALCLVGMRGGFGAIPISQSAGYFSNHNILNDASINPLWNIVCNIINFGSLNDEVAYCFMDNRQAEEIVDELNEVEKDTLVPVLKNNKINIVIILLESWTADAIESLTGTKDVTPNFHALEKEGLLFTNFYSNGHRSQQAISSILSSFPPVPNYDITDSHDKYKYLSTFSDVLQKQKYNSSFYFGGNLNYGNIRSFLLHANFKKIMEERDLGKMYPNGKLGIHDEYMFLYHKKELSKEKAPFFSILFTLSSHSPYDQPEKIIPLQWKTKEINYLNSVKYTDYCLGVYFEEVKKQPWYDNTLFIIVSDHSHPSHLNRDYYSKEYQHIPMLWVGNVLKDEYIGKKCGIVSSHIDIAPTLLNQLGYKKEAFKWGKDIFNPYCQHFAYFEINNGFGIITDNSFIIYYSISKNDESRIYFVGDSSQKESLLLKGKAYSQYLFETYCSY